MSHKESPFTAVVEWVGVFLIAFAVFALVRTFIVAPYTVPSESMLPTIQVGDNLFAQKVSLELGQPVKQGDIVVFDNPVSESDHEILVKRVIAVAGQTVDLRDGAVYVDGEALDEPYTQGESWPLLSQAAGVDVSFPYTVPEGHVWMMGDNRENSADSRYFGAVPNENLIGVAFFRYWPLDRLGTL
ncbi:MAG: signal peptidase I [Coriobacteriaceae bacterium]|nr:signal peptidase I [Coriobacteriaceae bacterium]